MGISELDMQWHPLSPLLGLDDHHTGADPGDGFSPPKASRQLRVWAPTMRGRRIRGGPAGGQRRPVSVNTRTFTGSALGESVHSEHGSLDRTVDNLRAAGLVATGTDPDDPRFDYRAHACRCDGGAASPEEAAAHVITTNTAYDVEE
jgi:hypothetical protein